MREKTQGSCRAGKAGMLRSIRLLGVDWRRSVTWWNQLSCNFNHEEAKQPSPVDRAVTVRERGPTGTIPPGAPLKHRIPLPHDHGSVSAASDDLAEAIQVSFSNGAAQRGGTDLTKTGLWSAASSGTSRTLADGPTSSTTSGGLYLDWRGSSCTRRYRNHSA